MGKMILVIEFNYFIELGKFLYLLGLGLLYGHSMLTYSPITDIF